MSCDFPWIVDTCKNVQNYSGIYGTHEREVMFSKEEVNMNFDTTHQFSQNSKKMNRRHFDGDGPGFVF